MDEWNFKNEIVSSRSLKYSELYSGSIAMGFSCCSFFLVGLSVALVYVLSDMDYFMLSGVFRVQRFYSDDPYYFTKQIVLIYGFIGFFFTMLIGPIGRKSCICWSWILTFTYIANCLLVYVFKYTQYGRLMMRSMSIVSLISHILLCNFIFFLFDPNVSGSHCYTSHRVLSFIVGCFVGPGVLSYILLRSGLFITGTFVDKDPILSSLDVCRILLIASYISMLSSLCISLQFTYEYNGGKKHDRLIWSPIFKIPFKVFKRTVFHFINLELMGLIWIINPYMMSLVPYTTKIHFEFHRISFIHKIIFSVLLVIFLILMHRDFSYTCVSVIKSINLAIFDIMFTDGYSQLNDGHLKKTPISNTPYPNFLNPCTSITNQNGGNKCPTLLNFTNGTPVDSHKNASSNRIHNTTTIPGLISYHFTQKYWDDTENEDKKLLSTCENMLLVLDRLENHLNYGYEFDLCNLMDPELSFKLCKGEKDPDYIKTAAYLLSEYKSELMLMLGNSLNRYSNERFALNDISPTAYNFLSSCCSVLDLSYDKYFIRKNINYSSRSLLKIICELYNTLVIEDFNFLDMDVTRITLLKHFISTLRKNIYDFVFIITSHMTITESNLVLSKSCDYVLDKDVFKLSSWVDTCPCVIKFELENVTYKYSFRDQFPKFVGCIKNDIEIKQLIDNEGNYFCLCLVVKYQLYPYILGCISYLRDMELDILSVSIKKMVTFTRSDRYNFSISKLIMFAVDVTKVLVNMMESRYLSIFAERKKTGYCLCAHADDPLYYYFITIICYICSLLDNLFTFDNENVQHSVQYLAALKAELDAMGCDKKSLESSSKLTIKSEQLCKSVQESVCCCNISVNIIVVSLFNCILSSAYNTLKPRSDHSCNCKETLEKFKAYDSDNNECKCEEIGEQALKLIECKTNMFTEKVKGEFIGLVSKGQCKMENCKCKDICVQLKENCKLMCEFSDSMESVKNKFKCSVPPEECSGKCADCKLLSCSISLLSQIYGALISQTFNDSIVRWICQGPQTLKNIEAMHDHNVSSVEKLLTSTRNNRIADLTHTITGNFKNMDDEHAINPKYHTYDDLYRPTPCYGSGFFKFRVTREFAAFVLILMFMFMRLRFDSYLGLEITVYSKTTTKQIQPHPDVLKLRDLINARLNSHPSSIITRIYKRDTSSEYSSSDEEDYRRGSIDYSNIGYTTSEADLFDDTSSLSEAEIPYKHVTTNNGVRSNIVFYTMVGAFAIVSSFYLNMVIRDLFVKINVEYQVWSYLINITIMLGMMFTIIIKYCVHLYDFIHVLEKYSVKLSRIEHFVDDAFGGVSGTLSQTSKFVMIYGLLKSMKTDFTSMFRMNVPLKAITTYNEMKDNLYPYKEMSGPVHRVATAYNENMEILDEIRSDVLRTLGKPGETLNLTSVLDFLSYILMSKGESNYDHYQSYFRGDERYIAWRLGKPLNHNFFLITYYRYTIIYEIQKQVQNMKMPGNTVALQNCQMFWNLYGDMQLEMIALKSMNHESVNVPMTDLQKEIIRAKFLDEYLNGFIRFQKYLISNIFSMKDAEIKKPINAPSANSNNNSNRNNSNNTRASSIDQDANNDNTQEPIYISDTDTESRGSRYNVNVVEVKRSRRKRGTHPDEPKVEDDENKSEVKVEDSPKITVDTGKSVAESPEDEEDKLSNFSVHVGRVDKKPEVKDEKWEIKEEKPTVTVDIGDKEGGGEGLSSEPQPQKTHTDFLRDIHQYFPYVHLLNKSISPGVVAKLTSKYYKSKYKKVMAAISIPKSTCDIRGSDSQVRKNVLAYINQWLTWRHEYCVSNVHPGNSDAITTTSIIACENAIKFAHGLVADLLNKPGNITSLVTNLLERINLENIDMTGGVLMKEGLVEENHTLRDYRETLAKFKPMDPIYTKYETTILHYLNQFVLSSMVNKDKIMLPLGIFLSWYGIPLCDSHIKYMHKFKYFI